MHEMDRRVYGFVKHKFATSRYFVYGCRQFWHNRYSHTNTRTCIPHRHQCHRIGAARDERKPQKTTTTKNKQSAMNVCFTGMKRIGWCGVCALCTRLSFTFPQCYCFMGRLFADEAVSEFLPIFFSLLLATRWRAWDTRDMPHSIFMVYYLFISILLCANARRWGDMWFGASQTSGYMRS